MKPAFIVKLSVEETKTPNRVRADIFLGKHRATIEETICTDPALLGEGAVMATGELLVKTGYLIKRIGFLNISQKSKA